MSHYPNFAQSKSVLNQFGLPEYFEVFNKKFALVEFELAKEWMYYTKLCYAISIGHSAVEIEYLCDNLLVHSFKFFKLS